MAELETALYTKLSGTAGLTALVGTRIFPDRIPLESTLPALVYQRISTVRPSAMGVDAGLAQVRLQLTAWAGSFAGAVAVIAQVRSALRRWRSGATSPVIQDSYLEGERALYDDGSETPDAGQSGAFGQALDVLIWHEE